MSFVKVFKNRVGIDQERVMDTVGNGIFRLSRIMALAAVLSHSIVLFLFASQGLERFLIGRGLPSLPLVPVSSS